MTAQRNHRIVHVPRRFVLEEWGGTETVVLEISKQQQRTGWQPEIFTTLALSRQRTQMIEGIPVKRFRYCYPFFGLSSAAKDALDKKGGNLLSASLFYALLGARQVRLFHAHTVNRLGGEVRTAARLRKKPYVVTLHGGMFDLPAEELAALLKPIEKKLEWGKICGAILGSRRVLEDADHVVCVGKSEYEETKQQINHSRIAYLPNGVDPERFARGDGMSFRRKHAIPDRDFLVGNISRIDAQKNQHLLLRAFAHLRASRPESHLLLIGPVTQPDYAEKLRAFIRENNLLPAVYFLPGMRNDDPDLASAFQACDVFVLPSIHEPFGIVVLEAWCSSKPVVVSRVGGSKDLLRHEETSPL